MSSRTLINLLQELDRNALRNLFTYVKDNYEFEYDSSINGNSKNETLIDFFLKFFKTKEKFKEIYKIYQENKKSKKGSNSKSKKKI